MAGSLIERALGLLELLASDARGLPLQQLADRQDHDTSRYRLSTRLAALGFRFLASSGVVDLVQPVLDGLARETGELVRLGVIEGDRQTWIAKSQGATSGLRYDPDMGREAPLFYTASGHAWLASLSDKAALALVERQGVGAARDFGPNAPRSRSELLRYLKRAREHGYAWQIECSAPGMAAMAAQDLSHASQASELFR